MVDLLRSLSASPEPFDRVARMGASSGKASQQICRIIDCAK
jgi:hypothetical protein